MNILITSVGRRTYLVNYFKEAMGKGDEIHVANSSAYTTAFAVADKSVITPLIYDGNYIPFLLNYCKENKIDAIISLFDVDLPILSASKDKFLEIGVKVIVSDYRFVSIANDKWKTFTFLKKNKFNVPKTYLTLKAVQQALTKKEIDYPIMIKPRFGMGSIGLKIAQNKEELAFYYRKILQEIKKSYLKYESASKRNVIIFQEMLNGQEYGVDIINDLDGKYIVSVVKKKLAMRAGETDCAEVVLNNDILDESKRLALYTNHIANLDSDWFLVDGKPYVLELNARFGGGYPFSHVAGVNLPKAIVCWLKGEEVTSELFEYKTNIVVQKEIVLKEI